MSALASAHAGDGAGHGHRPRCRVPSPCPPRNGTGGPVIRRGTHREHGPTAPAATIERNHHLYRVKTRSRDRKRHRSGRAPRRLRSLFQAIYFRRTKSANPVLLSGNVDPQTRHKEHHPRRESVALKLSYFHETRFQIPRNPPATPVPQKALRTDLHPRERRSLPARNRKTDTGSAHRQAILCGDDTRIGPATARTRSVQQR